MISELQIKTNQNKLFIIIILKATFAFGFLNWKCTFKFHIITEEASQHVWSELAFASQNLKFTTQILNDQR